MLFVAATLAFAPPGPLKGSERRCVKGKMHTLDYNATAGGSLLDLDGELGSKLDGVTCDMDNTKLTLSFRHRADATEWVVKFHDFTNHFIMGGANWNCTIKARSTYILRRVLSASQSEHLGRDLIITTTIARYDEVFESADISFGSLSHPDCLSKSEHVCLGANADCAGHAKADIPLFSGSKVTASCSDCYASIDADVFANVSIRGFKVQQLAAGFRNVHLDASLALDAKAEGQWSLAADKLKTLVPETHLLDFKVGSVPFLLFFTIPLEIKSDLTFNAPGELTAGAKGRFELGDLYVSWAPDTHWTHAIPSLRNATLAPNVKGAASVDASGSLAVLPTFELHFDRVFSYTLAASPSLAMQLQGSAASKQLCLTSSYDVAVVATTELDININVLDFHKDWTWGPTTVGSWTGRPLPKKCVGNSTLL